MKPPKNAEWHLFSGFCREHFQGTIILTLDPNLPTKQHVAEKSSSTNFTGGSPGNSLKDKKSFLSFFSLRAGVPLYIAPLPKTHENSEDFVSC